MKEWIRDIAIAILIAFIVVQFIKPTIVRESSMENTLFENNYIFLSKQSYTFGEPARGDIIVFHSDLKTAAGKEKLLIKRVIGLPGDVVRVDGGTVYINGEELIEDYTKDGETTGFVDDLTVPEGCLFVMGDNRRVSIDSRSDDVGCVNIDDVVGKAFFRLYPFNEMRTL